jgi:hypothetical protein
MTIVCMDKEAVQIQLNSSVRLPIRFVRIFSYVSDKNRTKFFEANFNPLKLKFL